MEQLKGLLTLVVAFLHTSWELVKCIVIPILVIEKLRALRKRTQIIVLGASFVAALIMVMGSLMASL